MGEREVGVEKRYIVAVIWMLCRESIAKHSLARM